MQYKLSRYIRLVECNDGVVVFNALNKKIAFISNKSVANSIADNLKDINITQNTDPVILWLYNNRFIIPHDYDESAAVKMAFIDNTINKNLGLTILPTLQCNFRCTYCYEQFDNQCMKENVIEDLISAVNLKMRDSSSLNVDWFGGEPLLAIDTINQLSSGFIDICKKRKKIYSAAMTTNGYYLTPDVFQQMLKNRVNSFQVTVDGLEDTHNASRKLVNGTGSYERVMANLRAIKNNKTGRFSVVIRTNVTKTILENLDEYIGMLNREFGGDRRFSFLFRPVGDWGGERVKSVKGEMLTSLNELYKKLIEGPYKLNYSPYYAMLVSSVCMAAERNSYVIKPDGKIGKCTNVLYDKTNEIGCINGGKFTIDESKEEKWSYRFDKLGEECELCNMLPTCFASSCPAKNLAGSKHKPCGYEQSNIDQVLRLLAKNKEKYLFVEKL